MNSKIKLIKSKFKKIFDEEGVIDIILFGSFIKGKENPLDIDVAIISEDGVKTDIEGFHIINLKPHDFLFNPPKIVNTLFREGYSLKHNKFLSEVYGFNSEVLFSYELKGLTASKKVKAVNVLRGFLGSLGLVVENSGEWIANQVFIVPVFNEDIFNDFFQVHKIKYNKKYILMH